MSWNQRPVTLTLGALLLAVTGFAAKTVLEGGDRVTAIASDHVRQHVDRDVDNAHPGLPKKYVTFADYQRGQHQIDMKLTGMQAVQRQILERLPRRRERR